MTTLSDVEIPTPEPEDEEDGTERSVSYGLEKFEELPPRAHGGGGGNRGATGRRSQLEDMLDKVKGDPSTHGSWQLIARYNVSTAATAAKNILQQRHGRVASVEGMEFATRRIDEGARTGLFVKYDPNSVEYGARENHEKQERFRVTRLLVERGIREGSVQTVEDVKKVGEDRRHSGDEVEELVMAAAKYAKRLADNAARGNGQTGQTGQTGQGGKGGASGGAQRKQRMTANEQTSEAGNWSAESSTV